VLFGYRVLGRAAAAFAADHPSVKLEVVVDDRHVDLLREGFDAALRENPRPDSELAGRLLMKSSLVLVASKTLAEKMGYPDIPVQNRTWPAVVRNNWGDRGIWRIETETGTVEVRADVKLSLSSPIAIRDAVLAGAGAAFLPKTFADDDLVSGRLIKLGVRSGPADEIWILHASGRLPSRRLAAFMDTLAEWIK
jgi:DNA-binding transcriptional LysR family regulator